MIVGAIGHTRHLSAEQRRWLHNTLRSWLARWDVALGYTNLEPMIGIHFAQVLAGASIPFRAILPQELPLMATEDRVTLDKWMGYAAGIQKLPSHEAIDPWKASRLQVVEHCEVVFAVMNGDAVADSSIQAAQLQACLAQRAVITLDLGRKSYHIACKHQQW